MFQLVYVVRVLFTVNGWVEDSPGSGDVVTYSLRPYRRIVRSGHAEQTRAETTLVGHLGVSIVDALLRSLGELQLSHSPKLSLARVHY